MNATVSENVELRRGLIRYAEFLRRCRLHAKMTALIVHQDTGVAVQRIEAAEVGATRLSAMEWLTLVKHYKCVQRIPDGFCRMCGCFDAWACAGGCAWVQPGLCSSCAAIGELLTSRLTWLLNTLGRPAKCTRCPAQIHWARNVKTGRMMPMNPDGTSHFADCPAAGEFRRRA